MGKPQTKWEFRHHQKSSSNYIIPRTPTHESNRRQLQQTSLSFIPTVRRTTTMEIAASIVGLLSAGAKISQAMERFIQSTANAPSLAQTVKEEMNTTSFILSKLHNLDLGPTSTFADRESLANTVAGCEATFSELEEHTQRLTASDKMDIRDRIYWAWAESTLKPLIHRLQQHKASLTLILILLKKFVTLTDTLRVR